MFKDIFKRISGILDKPVKNKHLKYGLPFFGFMTFALIVFSQLGKVRYQFRKGRTVSREELINLGIDVSKKPETLEEAYEKYQKVDIDNWENIRGPRLWDEETS